MHFSFIGLHNHQGRTTCSESLMPKLRLHIRFSSAKDSSWFNDTAKISPEVCQKSIRNYPERLQDVKEARGYGAKYRRLSSGAAPLCSSHEAKVMLEAGIEFWVLLSVRMSFYKRMRQQSTLNVKKILYTVYPWPSFTASPWSPPSPASSRNLLASFWFTSSSIMFILIWEQFFLMRFLRFSPRLDCCS